MPTASKALTIGVKIQPRIITVNVLELKVLVFFKTPIPAIPPTMA
jgi:hypothetical protein